MNQNEYAIAQLKAIPLLYDNLEQIKELVKLLQLPIVNAKAKAGFIVTRARRGQCYSKKADMTYKSAEICTTAQRASLPYQTVFYGVISDNERHLENARAICVSECSILAAAGEKSVGREYIANSQWQICEDIDVACITSEHSFDGVQNNKLLYLIKENFISKFSKNEEVLNLAEFIENEFSKRVFEGNNGEYILSATISDILFYTYGFEAIAYPSVKLGGQVGLNIAIRPDVADKKLRLVNIADQCYYKNGNKGIVRIESCYDVSRGEYMSVHQCSDDILCQQLGILKIDDLKIIE